jgi:hypothetical protein
VVGFWKPNPLSFLSRKKRTKETERGRSSGKFDCIDVLNLFLLAKLGAHFHPPFEPDFYKESMNFVHFCSFLGTFAKLRQTTIGFIMSVRLSVRMEKLGCHWMDFHEI